MTTVASALPTSRLKERLPALLLPALIVVLSAITATVEPRFFGINNIINVLRNASYLAILSAGQMLVLIVGGFDLSIGAAVALSSVLSAATMASLFATYPEMAGLAIAAGAVVAFVAGLVAGALNGGCVVAFGASPFMVTLGSLSILSGLAFYVTAGAPIYGLPVAFTEDFGRATLFGLPIAIPIAVLFCGLLHIVMLHTRLGRHWYAAGGNPAAARLSGIRLPRLLVLAYVVSASAATIVGLLLTARLGSGQASLGSDLMLQSLAACMIAGVSLRGGVGRIPRVAMGAIFLSLVSNSLNLVRVDSKLQTIAMGIIVVASVLVDRNRKG